MSQPCIPEHSEAYTVAWITALPHERAAGEAMFDEEFEDPPANFKQSSGDPNAYSWGRIGKHYVVLAGLPKGKYGTTSTATMVQGLRSSLPHIRIGLLVGIGAGVREILDKEGNIVGQRNISLGDVTISSHEGTTGGVVQYDLVKAKTVDGTNILERHGSLNSPPPALGTALGKLEAMYEKKGSNVPAIMAEALKKYSRMRAPYGHPGLREAEVDRRTDTYYPRDGPAVSTDARECPKVYYGIIASSNTLVKSVHYRTEVLARLAKENIKPVCFEMEAGGLMDNFPCLVIRGICDYADEYKNDDWQKYAAMTAAAVAKELLVCVNVQQVVDTQGIGKLMLQKIDTIHQKVEQSQQDVFHVKSNTNALRRSQILDWLCSFDYSFQIKTHPDKYQEGTGKWFLEDSKFLDWVRADESSTLFCPGGPGCGKTIMSTLVIDHLSNEPGLQRPVIYFFFDYQKQKEQTPEHFMATLLRQLASLSQEVFDAIEKLHDKLESLSQRPRFNELQSQLQSAFRKIARVSVVIDAWDECEAVTRAECANTLRHCVSDCVAHLLVTTRDNHMVQQLFAGDAVLRIQAPAEDLRLYATKRADELTRNIDIDKELVKDVIERVVDASQGMFLLARLHMNNINEQTTVNEVEDMLHRLRKDTDLYSSAYGATMERITQQPKPRRELAMRILAWVVHARYPLSFTELNHALATRIGSKKFDTKDTYSEKVVFSVCAGLLTLDGDTPRLIHYTTQEYFRDTWTKWFSKESVAIVDTCLTYLSFDEFSAGPCDSEEAVSSRWNEYKLFKYAAQNWGYHLKDQYCLAETDKTESTKILSFLQNKPLIQNAAQAMYMSNDSICGIHLTAYFGLQDLTMHLVAEGQDPDVEDSDGRTPLWRAASNGYEGLVKALLDTKRVDINRRGRYPLDGTFGRTPLSVAAKNGHEAVVKLLLTYDQTAVDECDMMGRTPLSLAAMGGHENVVQILLDTGLADINKQDPWGRTPLHFAAEVGHEGVVKVLLASKGVNVHLGNNRGWTALDWAIAYELDRIAALIIAAGASATSKDHDGISGLKTEQSKRKEQPREENNLLTRAKRSFLSKWRKRQE